MTRTFFVSSALTAVMLFGILFGNQIVESSPTAARLHNSMPLIDIADTNTVLLPNRSPLVSFRVLFMTGSAFDPRGKEGVASLTAAMLAQGGSRTKTYAEITDAMYPMATSFQWQGDKEMTVFSGTTHIDNLEKYYSLIREMLLDH